MKQHRYETATHSCARRLPAAVLGLLFGFVDPFTLSAVCRCVCRAWTGPRATWTRLDLRWPPQAISAVLANGHLRGVSTLILRKTSLSVLTRFDRLVELHLDFIAFKERDGQLLSESSLLARLFLTNCTDEHHLASWLPNVDTLSVRSYFSDPDLPRLLACASPRLRRLVLTKLRAIDVGTIEGLTGLVELKFLSLEFSVGTFACLASMPSLRKLEISEWYSTPLDGQAPFEDSQVNSLALPAPPDFPPASDYLDSRMKFIGLFPRLRTVCVAGEKRLARAFIAVLRLRRPDLNVEQREFV